MTFRSSTSRVNGGADKCIAQPLTLFVLGYRHRAAMASL